MEERRRRHRDRRNQLRNDFSRLLHQLSERIDGKGKTVNLGQKLSLDAVVIVIMNYAPPSSEGYSGTDDHDKMDLVNACLVMMLKSLWTVTIRELGFETGGDNYLPENLFHFVSCRRIDFQA